MNHHYIKNKTSYLSLGKTLLTGLTLGTLLVGCGSSSSNSNETKDTHDNLSDSGRFAVYDQDNQAINVLDIESELILDTYAISGDAPRLYASPNKRYAVITQRSNDSVSFLDGGLYSEDHGDHSHSYTQDPAMLNFSLNASRPTHYTTHGTQSAVFLMDKMGWYRRLPCFQTQRLNPVTR